jgi:hypothetical protein
MKQITIGLLNGILFLSACGQATTIPVIENATSTPSLLPTNTSSPTHAPTATITPLPAIPTFTPTFDASTIVTVTPAPKAECPELNPTLAADFPIPDLVKCHQTGDLASCHSENMLEGILEFLNKGGSIDSVIKRLQTIGYQNDRGYLYQDLTVDSIPDLVVANTSFFRQYSIYVCKAKKYELFSLNGEPPTSFHALDDLNLNGIPEVILTGGDCSGSGCLGIDIYEWNGKEFTNLGRSLYMFGPINFDIRDIDKNGTKEILLTGDRPGMCCVDIMTPWRYKTVIYSWDGRTYSESYTSFENIQYRFQAIQDADREILYGNYDLALTYYRDAVFNNNLEWWSKERRDYEVKVYYDSYNPITPTPLPYPMEDTTEYPRLAAYAYYRIMLLHLVQGNESEAITAYNTLQEKFGNDPYGQPYVEMASAFWEAYQSTHKVYDGCAAAIQYAAENPEILIPLGSDYHGAQAKIYKPEDVCPFR